jgi:mevalonate kinase
VTSEHPNKMQFSASGKLMLFGEYMVLAGGKSLALPVKFGQSMEVTPNKEVIEWKSTSPQGEWFNCELDKDLNTVNTNNLEVAEKLQKIFKDLKKKLPNLYLYNKFNITADFNIKWGLGSSSTFISLVSQWSNVNPYQLQKAHFGGSGYDIAAATENKLFVYTSKKQHITQVELNESIKSKTLFGYLGNKQDTHAEIGKFNAGKVTESILNSMNDIIDRAISTDDIEEFEDIMTQSEELLSPILGRPTLKQSTFEDYNYGIKSLGAWGGDFFMATFRDINIAKEYFINKGNTTLFTYNEIAK